MPVPIANRSFGTNFVQQFAPGQLTKQCSHATCREHEAYLSLRPVRISEISGDVGAEACQHGSEEKIDAVESIKARIGSRNICSSEGTRRDRHIACIPSVKAAVDSVCGEALDDVSAI
jgi:hypothetical protein